MGNKIPVIVRDGTIFSCDYVRDNNLLSDFSLLTLDVSNILSIRRANVQTYVLPQLDYIKVDSDLKEELNNRALKNLISKKSVNEYIKSAFAISEKRVAIVIERLSFKNHFKERFPMINLHQVQQYIDEALIGLEQEVVGLQIEPMVSLPTEFDFVNTHKLWSTGILLDEAFDYNQQITRMLKNVSYIKGHIHQTKSTTEKENDKGIRYVFPDGEMIDDLYKKIYSRKTWSFSISYELYHYINSLIYKEHGVFRKNSKAESFKIKELFAQKLFDKLSPYISDAIRNNIDCDLEVVQSLSST